MSIAVDLIFKEGPGLFQDALNDERQQFLRFLRPDQMRRMWTDFNDLSQFHCPPY